MTLEPQTEEPVAGVVRALWKTALGSAGPLGSAISHLVDELLPGRASRLMRDRLERFLEDLRDEFVRVVRTDGSDKFPLDYLQAQDFAHLVLVAADAVRTERDREKVRAIARLLGNAAKDRFPVDRVEEALRSLAELTTADFTVLKAVLQWRRAAGRDADAGILDSKKLEPFLPGFPDDRITPYLARLQRTGLVLEDTKTWDRADGGQYAATPLLAELDSLLAD